MIIVQVKRGDICMRCGWGDDSAEDSKIAHGGNMS